MVLVSSFLPCLDIAGSIPLTASCLGEQQTLLYAWVVGVDLPAHFLYEVEYGKKAETKI